MTHYLETLTTPVCEIRPLPAQRIHHKRPIVYLCTTAGRAQALLIHHTSPLTKTEITALFSLLPEVAKAHPKLSKQWGYQTIIAHPAWAGRYAGNPAPQPLIHFTL